MLNILFNPEDTIEIRCLPSKDDVGPIISKFGNIEKIRGMVKELKTLNQRGYNIYFGVNPRDGESRSDIKCCRTLCLDLDGAGHSMTLDEALPWLEILQTDWMVPYPSVITESGNGIHFFWRLDKDLSVSHWTRMQKALIATINLSGKIADGCIHDGPRIMRLPGFVNHRGGRLCQVVYEHINSVSGILDFELTLENLKVNVAPPPEDYQGENENALARALKYFEHRNGAREGARNAEGFKIAAACVNDFGLSDQDSLHVLQVWNQKNGPPMPVSELQELIKKARKHASGQPCSKDRPKPTNTPALPPPPAPEPEPEPEPEPQPDRNKAGVDLQVLSHMLQNYVLISGTTDVWDLESGMIMPVAALGLLFPREIKYWKTDFNRRAIPADKLTFSPSGVVAPDEINTFRGFNFQRDPRPMPLFMAHLEMLCGDDQQVFEWVLSWMAHQVQKPGKMATSIIMHGKQGTGKTMLWECFGRIFGEYFSVIDQSILESDFNSWASRRCFVLAEEVLATQSKSRLKNVLKQMITGGSIQINQKFSRPWSEPCHMNMVFLSNNRLPMLLDEDDRRFLVIRTDNRQDDGYFRALAAEIADNGPARLYTTLMDWNLQGFDAHTKPLMTDAKRNLIRLVRDSAKSFMDDWLSNGIEGLPPITAKRQDLYDAYNGYCRASGYRPQSRRHFYAVIDQDYPAVRVIRSAYIRAYAPPTDTGEERPTAEVYQFNEAMLKYLGGIQARRV